MDKLNNNTNDELIEDKKTINNYYERYRNTLQIYEDVRYETEGASCSDDEIKRLESDDSIYDISDVKFYDLMDRAISMYEGKVELDKEWFLQLFEKLYNREIFDILTHTDYHNLCNDKDFILGLMEHSGAVCEIASFASEDVIKHIFEDGELLEKIYKKEVLASSNLNGDEILSVLLLQLNYFEDLTQEKEFMTNVLKTVENLGKFYKYNDASMAFRMINYILAENCEELLKERDFTETVFDFVERMTEKSRNDKMSYPSLAVKGLAKKMLLTPELSSNEELAKRYVKDFKYLYNIDESFLKNKDFMKIVLDECDDVVFDNLEFPLEFYSDSDMLEKYLSTKAKVFGGVNGINFDFDNEVFAEVFEKCYDESIEECMREEIAKAIEQNKSIVISGDESFDYDEIVSVLQQWAEDNDLIKIGDKIQVLKNPNGEIVEGKLNIVTGENGKNTITDSNDKTTIVLDGHKIAGILRQIGIDTRIDIDKMQELYNEMIETLRQRCEEGKIMPQDVIEIVKSSNLLNEGQNYINVKEDEDSGKTEAIISIPHPVYRNEFLNVELDGEELRKIIELANNNSLDEAKRILDEIASKGIGEVSVINDYGTRARFRSCNEKVIGTLGGERDSAYLVGGELLSDGRLSGLMVKLPYRVIKYNFIFSNGLCLQTVETEMDDEQVKEFNQTDKELDIDEHEYRYGRPDGEHTRKVFCFQINDETYHVKEDDCSNGGRYTVIWKGDEESIPEIALGFLESDSEWASAQTGIDEKGLIRFINANPRRFTQLFEAMAKKYDCCGVFPKMYLESLCSSIMQMPIESELRREEEQELMEDFLDEVVDLASQKKKLKEKETGARILLEQYEQLNQNNNKSVSDE